MFSNLSIKSVMLENTCKDIVQEKEDNIKVNLFFHNLIATLMNMNVDINQLDIYNPSIQMKFQFLYIILTVIEPLCCIIFNATSLCLFVKLNTVCDLTIVSHSVQYHYVLKKPTASECYRKKRFHKIT